MMRFSKGLDIYKNFPLSNNNLPVSRWSRELCSYASVNPLKVYHHLSSFCNDQDDTIISSVFLSLLPAGKAAGLKLQNVLCVCFLKETVCLRIKSREKTGALCNISLKGNGQLCATALFSQFLRWRCKKIREKE